MVCRMLCGIAGSSPRMWGTQRLFESFRHLRRFIPTHVGNSLHIITPRKKSPSIHQQDIATRGIALPNFHGRLPEVKSVVT